MSVDLGDRGKAHKQGLPEGSRCSEIVRFKFGAHTERRSSGSGLFLIGFLGWRRASLFWSAAACPPVAGLTPLCLIVLEE